MWPDNELTMVNLDGLFFAPWPVYLRRAVLSGIKEGWARDFLGCSLEPSRSRARGGNHAPRNILDRGAASSSPVRPAARSLAAGGMCFGQSQALAGRCSPVPPGRQGRSLL